MTKVFSVGRRVIYRRTIDGWWGCGTANTSPKEWHKYLWSLLLHKGI